MFTHTHTHSHTQAALGAGLPLNTPAHTVTLACISSNVAINTAMQMVQLGNADVVICGGVETMSDVPIRLSRGLRKTLLDSRKVWLLSVRVCAWTMSLVVEAVPFFIKRKRDAER